MTGRSAGACGMLVALTGCLQVEVEVPSICIERSVAADGLDPATVEAAGDWLEDAGEVEVVQQVDADLDAGLESLGVELDQTLASEETALWVRHGRMWTPDHESMAFVQGVSIAVLGPESTAVPVLSYERPKNAPVSDELFVDPVVTGADAMDLLEWLDDGELSLAVVLDVDVESLRPELTLQTELCMAGTVFWERRWVDVEDR